MTVALERLIAVEFDASIARRLAGRLRFACLPTPATLADFDVDAAAGIGRALIDELRTCRYLESATNIMLIGPPGTDGTHLSVGSARAAAHPGYRTYFALPPTCRSMPPRGDSGTLGDDDAALRRTDAPGD